MDGAQGACGSKHQKYYNKYSIAYLPGNWKSTDTLIKVFKYHLKDHKMNILRFDNEPAIQSKQFQQFLKDNNIYFQLTIANMHTSLALIDRVCRTIRDISFNLNLKGGIYNQQAMDLILYYYNNTAHDTLTQMLFKLYPDLKKYIQKVLLLLLWKIILIWKIYMLKHVSIIILK